MILAGSLWQSAAGCSTEGRRVFLSANAAKMPSALALQRVEIADRERRFARYSITCLLLALLLTAYC